MNPDFVDLLRAFAAADVRFLIVMREFDGISGGAIWQDLKMGVEHLHAWKRIALVTDISWMSPRTDLFGWLTPGKTKTITLDRYKGWANYERLRRMTSKPRALSRRSHALRLASDISLSAISPASIRILPIDVYCRPLRPS